jgi:hypothetical protein
VSAPRLTAAEKPLLKKCRVCSAASRCKPARLRPSIATLMRWDEQGKCKTPSGKWVEPDGRDPNGCPSWLIILGMI